MKLAKIYEKYKFSEKLKKHKILFWGKVKTQVSYPESHPQRSGQHPRPVDWVWLGSIQSLSSDALTEDTLSITDTSSM